MTTFVLLLQDFSSKIVTAKILGETELKLNFLNFSIQMKKQLSWSSNVSIVTSSTTNNWKFIEQKNMRSTIQNEEIKLN